MLPDINSCFSSILHFFIHASRNKFKLFLHASSASNILYKVLVRDAHRKRIIDIFKELKIFFIFVLLDYRKKLKLKQWQQLLRQLLLRPLRVKIPNWKLLIVFYRLLEEYLLLIILLYTPHHRQGIITFKGTVHKFWLS